MDTKHLTPGITEQQIADAAEAQAIAAEERTLGPLRAASPELYAKSRKGILRAWLIREARHHGWPVARLAAALATELIDIAIDTIHDSSHGHDEKRPQKTK